MSRIKIDSRTIRQRVYDELKKEITEGLILPGQKVSLRDLAETFGVSLMPVREAVWQLESERIIIVESNRRIRVNQLTPEEMEEALRIRLVLEVQAARRACERRPESAVKRLGSVLEAMIALQSKPRKYVDKNMEFHFTVYECADSPILLDFIHNLWARVGPYFFIHAERSESLADTQDSHRHIFNAFAAKDPDAVEEALRNDLLHTAQQIRPILGETTPET
jgi:DNA-binding GntR family transcriptional regulator